jgi:hypothetical protein
MTDSRRAIEEAYGMVLVFKRLIYLLGKYDQFGRKILDRNARYFV